MSPEEIRRYRDQLTSLELETRLKAVRAFQAVKGSAPEAASVLDDLEQVVSADPEPTVRVEAFEAIHPILKFIYKHDIQQLVDKLFTFLNNSSCEVRIEAADSLGQLPPVEASNTNVKQRLDDELSTEFDADVRQSIARAYINLASGKEDRDKLINQAIADVQQGEDPIKFRQALSFLRARRPRQQDLAELIASLWRALKKVYAAELLRDIFDLIVELTSDNEKVIDQLLGEALALWKKGNLIINPRIRGNVNKRLEDENDANRSAIVEIMLQALKDTDTSIRQEMIQWLLEREGSLKGERDQVASALQECQRQNAGQGLGAWIRFAGEPVMDEILRDNHSRTMVAGVLLTQVSDVFDAWWDHDESSRYLVMPFILDTLRDTKNPMVRQLALYWLRTKAEQIPGGSMVEAVERVQQLKKDEGQLEARNSATSAFHALVRVEKTFFLDLLEKPDSGLDAQTQAVEQLVKMESADIMRSLIRRWTHWIAEGDRTVLVETTAEQLRSSPYAVLPLIDRLNKAPELEEWIREDQDLLLQDQRDQDQKPLFSVESRFQSDLEQGNLSPDLWKEFEKHKITLSQNAPTKPNDRIKIVSEAPNPQWRITDSGSGRNQVYTVRVSENEMLNVYRGAMVRRHKGLRNKILKQSEPQVADELIGLLDKQVQPQNITRQLKQRIGSLESGLGMPGDLSRTANKQDDDQKVSELAHSFYDKSVERRKMQVTRRIAKLVADMSDSRFFEEAEKKKYEDIKAQLKKHAVPALAHRLPNEPDLEIRESLARTLANVGELQAVDALAVAVVGDERIRTARQDLLAQYYLEPSRARSEEAAKILKDAVAEARRTLRLLQGLNIATFVVGIIILVGGVLAAVMNQETSTRVLGALAGLGGLAGVLTLLIRDPLDRIQNAMANLVQLETAFTSFIWELNLNGTYIQSRYVAEGILSNDEIAQTVSRIEGAMNLAMNVVAVYTTQGRQRVVTRISALSPASGEAGASITVIGQYLRGDDSQKKANEGMIAINHTPVKVENPSWEENQVKFKLPPVLPGLESGAGIVWISLLIDGMETNALPFHVMKKTG